MADADFLEKVIKKRRQWAASQPPVRNPKPSTEPFERIFFRSRPAIIAEIKPISPADGPLLGHRTPTFLANAYVQGGADALSVLTEPDFFGGSFDLLSRVHAEGELPLLAKDIVVSEVQILLARKVGASSILLMVDVLEDGKLSSFVTLARSLGMEPVVEVHDPPGLERALQAGALIVGVNSRSLRTLQINRGVHRDLVPLFPSRVIPVAASGLSSPAEARELADLGYRGFLMGTALMTAPDPTSFLRNMIGLLKEKQ